ncbi:AraC family transcriptional regulator [Variovorax sp. ZS18.2.2]|uniref:AraC family transcriptional regulator n=1 Tax=Variovorax sp. ZS18.2.2 TaxID=2971255 RepID=UPI002150F313|nr:AraC family transcriptional regulator [Variovorax sp. ZS18.2.2]MCR6477155.1 AraC family transcriptional regulator [Variovorax sp. ZS18.2.2]
MHQAVVRSAVLVRYANFARRVGLDPLAMLQAVEIDPATLASPDLTVAAFKVYRLLELSANLTGLQDFGLRLGREGGSLSYLGALGALARDEPTLRDALLRFAHDTHLHNTCMALEIAEARGVAVIHVTVLAEGEPTVRQSTEYSLSVLHLTMRQLIGAAWSPTSIQFMHRCAGSDQPHRLVFGCPVHFSAEGNAFVLPATDLDLPLPAADSGLRVYATVDMGSLALPDRGFVSSDRVKQTMLRLLPLGRCRADVVAQTLAMDRRTLHRHLARSGKSYTELLHETRLELAKQYLSAGALSVTDIGGLLGFGSVNNFSRWFVTQQGVAPSRWRARVQDGPA